jgi:EpsI family protein
VRLARPGLVAAAFIATFVAVRPGTPATPVAAMVALPLTAGTVTARQATLARPDTIAMVGADEYIYRVYRGGAQKIEMDVAYYGDPRVGRVMHSPLNCLPGNGWEISRVQTLPIADRWEARSLIAERGDTRLALMYWYQTPARVTASEVASRFHLLVDALRGGRRDTALVRLVTPLRADSERATASLTQVAGALIPQIATQLQ